MRVAAAVKWYELGKVSQGKAAEIAGLSRSAFITALSRCCVIVVDLDAAIVTVAGERCPARERVADGIGQRRFLRYGVRRAITG